MVTKGISKIIGQTSQQNRENCSHELTFGNSGFAAEKITFD
jgi:hypothetical protein